MTLHFLVVGLEARRELEVGQLRERWTVRIPLGWAIGGMATAVRSTWRSTQADPELAAYQS